MPQISSGADVALLLITLAVLALPVWYFARAYRQDWRERRAGRIDEPMAWVRVKDPYHPDLPSPTRQAPMLPKPDRWSLGRVTIYAVQAAAVGWLVWLSMGGSEPGGIANERWGAISVAVPMAVIIVAFFTALLMNLWFRAGAKLQRLPFRLGRAVRRLRRPVGA